MTVDFIKISPSGNTTILVTSPVDMEKRACVASELMKSDSVTGEQAGFLEKPQSIGADIRLCMMGGEFCANATMATAAYLAREKGETDAVYSIEVSGCPTPLRVAVREERGEYVSTVPMPLPATLERMIIRGVSAPIVHMPGISHAILPMETADSFTREDIKSLSALVVQEAFGLMFYGEGAMRPYVYVKPTDTAVWESACGSGSAAVGVWSALERNIPNLSIKQPGGVIEVSTVTLGNIVAGLSITGKARVTTQGKAYIGG